MLSSILDFLAESTGIAAVSVCSILFERIGSGLSDMERYIPGLDALDSILTAAGAAVAVACLYLRLTGAAASSMTGIPTEHPVRIAAECILAALAVPSASPLCRLSLALLDTIYSRILAAAPPPGPGDGSPAAETLGSILSEVIPRVSGASVLLRLVLVLLLCWSVIKITLLVFEHYLLLTVCVHLSPLLVSLWAHPGTREMTKSFVRSFLTQCLSLICTAWGFRIFLTALTNSRTLSADGTTLLQMLVLILFGNVVASLDSLLNKLGLQTFPTADSIRSGVTRLTAGIESAVTTDTLRTGIREIKRAVSSAPVRSGAVGRFPAPDPAKTDLPSSAANRVSPPPVRSLAPGPAGESKKEGET